MTKREGAGVLYMLTGRRHQPLLAVSLWTLRTRAKYAGQVCIAAGDKAAWECSKRLCDDERLGPLTARRWEAPTHRHASYENKAFFMAELSPFARTVFLDADTAPVRPIEELFPQNSRETVLTQFCTWTTQGTRVTGRVKKWEHVALFFVQRALEQPWPAVNTGVMAFGCESPFMSPWAEMTKKYPRAFIGDEISAQLLLPEFWGCNNFKILDHRWNFSPIYSPGCGVENELAIIYHFHGKKHLRKKQGRIIWEPMFIDAWRENIGEIRGWAGECDPQLVEIGKGGE